MSYKQSKSYISVAKNSIAVNTNTDWGAIEIDHLNNRATFAIKATLPTTFMYAKNNKKTLIVNFGQPTKDLSELFTYTGIFNPKTIKIYDKAGNVELCRIETSRETWSDLRTEWESIKSKIYKNKEFNGDNRYKKIIKYKTDPNNKRKLTKDYEYKQMSKILPKDVLHKYLTGIKVDSEDVHIDIKQNKIIKGKLKD